MLLATEIGRVFNFTVKGQTIPLTDPDPSMSPEAVLNFYSGTYPGLTTAKIAGPEMKDDKWEFKFESVMGTKG